MKSLIIQAPSSGIAQSPHTGFGMVKNLDIYTTPGVAKLNNLLAKKTASTVDALVKWIVRDPDTPANIFALDSNGVLYKSADTGATWAEVSNRLGAGQGLIVKWGYVFVACITNIDVMKISDSSWTLAWQTIDTDSLWHPMISSDNDNLIYGGAGKYVFSIEQNSGETFVPGTAASYTFTKQALDLPDNYRIKCLEELGNNLMIGTWVGTTITDFKKANIFPWDRSNPTFGQPIKITENGVNAMINIRNQLYIMAGLEGNLYRSDGYNAVQIAEIPQYIADLDGGKYLEPYPGAMINFKGRLFFGISGSTILSGCGVYSLKQTGSGNILVMEHTISSGNQGTLKQLQIGALLGLTRDEMLISWRDDTTFGIDKTTNTSRATAYAGSFESPLYSISSVTNTKKFNTLEVSLAKPLLTNEGIKVEYRHDLSESWTTIVTFSYTNYGGERTKNFITTEPKNIKASEIIQFRVSLTGTTTSPQYKHIELK